MADACHEHNTDLVKMIELADRLWQRIADWLPSFRERVHLHRTSSSMSFEWRLAPPAVFEACMAGMNIGDTGARAIAQALAAGLVPPHHISRLRLNNNGITDDGATALAEALAVSNVIRVYLENNEIGDVGAHALSAVFRGHACLKELDLRQNCLSEACKSDLRPCAKQGIFVDWSQPSATYIKDVQFTRIRIEKTLDGDIPFAGVIYDVDMVDQEMRFRIVDWLFVVCSLWFGPEFDDIYHLNCNILDRYLSQRPVTKNSNQLPLLVLAILLVALDVKPEEYSATAERLAVEARAACTPNEIVEMAVTVQETLVHLKQPTAFTFAKRYMSYIGHNEDSWSLVRYLLALSTLCYNFLKYKPSVVAAAAVIIAGINLSESGSGYISGWQKALLFWLQHECEEVELHACLEELSPLHVAVHSRHARDTHSSSDAMPKISEPETCGCCCAVAEFYAIDLLLHSYKIFSDHDNNSVALKQPVLVQIADLGAESCTCCAGSGQVDTCGLCPLCDGHGYM